MNREITFVCSFMMGIMVFSSFTPFAYAIQDEKSLDFSLIKKVGDSCSDDVWFDELDWDEYQALVSQSVQQIDGWGDQGLQAVEESYEDAGVGTNAEAINSKHLFLPGVDGKPALLYDVMKKKAVDDSNVCHLDNLFSNGRIAYATSLIDAVRYCATDGSEPCERTANSKDAEEILNAASTLNDTNAEDKEGIFANLEKDAPVSRVISSDAKLTLNSDTNIFFLKTAADFQNFLMRWAPVDTLIATANMFAVMASLPAAAKGLKSLFTEKVFPGIYKGLFTKANFGRALSKSAIDLKAGKSIEAIQETYKTTKKSLKATTNEGANARGELLDALREGYSPVAKELNSFEDVNLPGLGKTHDIADTAISSAKTVEEGLKAERELATTYKSLFKKLSNIKNSDGLNGLSVTETDNLKAILKLNDEKLDLSTNQKVYDALEKFVKASGGSKALVNMGENLDRTMGLKLAYNALEEGSAAMTTETSKALKLIDIAEEETSGLSALSYEASFWTGPYKYYTALSAGRSKTEIARLLLTSFLGNNPLFSRLFLATQISQSLFMGTLFLRNTALAYPNFEAQGVITLELNNELANYAVTNVNEPHYIEVKKTSGLPSISRYLSGIFTRFLTSTSGMEETQKNELQNKIKNIQDIVFILDQNGIVSESDNNMAVNVITPKNSGNDWRFFSKFSSSTLIYNFEHPKGYTPKGKSALFISLRNINVYGVSGLPNEWFTHPIDEFIDRIRPFRNLVGTLTLFGSVPVGLSLISGPLAIAVAIPIAYQGYREVLNYKDDIVTGDMIDTTVVDEEQLCKNKFDVGDRNTIRFLKSVRLATAFCSAGAVKATGVGMLIGIGCDAIQLTAGWFEGDKIYDLTKGLQTCAETNYEVVALKEIYNPQELQNQSKSLFEPLKLEALNIFNSLAPEVNSQFDSLAQSTVQQVMHIQVDAEDNPLTSVVGTELYYVYFKDADIKWFQGTNCNIDLCQADGGGYACMTQNGYWLLDAEGNPLLAGTPQALSLRMNLKDGYAGIVQRVVEVKKKDDSFMKIYPDTVAIDGDCLKESFVNLSGTSDLSEKMQEEEVSSLFGQLDAIYTPKAQIWFDGKDVAVNFFEETTCANDVTFGADEIFRFTNSHIKLYKDAIGKVEIIGNDSQTKCSFELGSQGAVGFSNAMIRSGFAQTKDNITSDYSDVYHVFIYNLVTMDSGDVTQYNMEACEIDGTSGFRPVIETDDSYQEEQWNTLFGGMCYVDVEGSGNSSVSFDGNTITVVDPTGVAKKYTILYYDASCGGYRVVDEAGEETCLSMSMGPNGQPQITVDAQAPVPLLWATGMGGSFMYDPSTGRISISNEFPFALNSNFALYGAGGLGMMTATLPPWGGKVSDADTGTDYTSTNILAALPWMPEGLELMLFIVALAGGLLFVRIRFRKEKEP